MYSVCVRDRAAEAHRLPACRRDLIDGDLCVTQVIDHDFGATRRQLQRMAAAQAGACSGHDGDLPVKADRRGVG